MKFAERPKLLVDEPGTISRNPVRVNSFELEAPTLSVQSVKLESHEKQVALEPGKLKRLLGKASAALKPELGELMVFGTQLVASRAVAHSLKTHAEFEDAPQTVVVTPVQAKDASAQKEFVLNNLFNRAQARAKLTQIGRKFFDVQTRQQVDPELRLSVVTGQSSAVHVQHELAEGAWHERLLLEVDTTQKVYFDLNVLQGMDELRARLGGDNNLQNAVLARQRNRYVITVQESSRAQRIVDVDFNLTPASTFQLTKRGAEPREVSQADQLHEVYGLTLNTVRQPLLVAEVKRGRGGKVDRVQLVPECCRETGLNDELRASGFMMKLMRFKPRPDDRLRLQQDFLTRLFTEQKDLFAAWGVKLLRNTAALKQLEAGRIPPGRITFGGSSHDLGAKSMFDREAQGSIFSAPSAFKWAILSLQDDRENVQAKNTFVKEFQTACARAKFTVDAPVMQECPRNAQQWLEHMKNLRNADLLLLILPTRGRKKDDLNLYKLGKRLCVAELGLATQCVLHKTLTNPKGVTSVVSKILTQVVSKLNNGAPWGLLAPDCADRPTMVCGADVWHGAGKSILGFTASLDAHFSKYTSEARQQALKEELSAELAACVLAACEAFKTLNGVAPHRIVLFRDGVSEGQFSTALNQEVAAVLDALARQRIDAKLTYVVVNKQTDSKVLDASRNDGCAEGTVVDSLITRRAQQDFLLVPLQSRNGLANPVHYAVLQDGSQEDNARSIRPAALYSLTYKLCFMYYNWTGPVRVPAPCMFAHKLAYLLGDLQDKDQVYMPKPKLMSTVSCWYL